jgi:hypothetical protein
MTIDSEAPSDRRFYVTTLALLMLLWAAVIIVPPFVALSAGFHRMSFGEPRPQHDYDVAHTLDVWAGVLAVVLPALGLTIAALSRRTVNAVAFGVVLLLYAVVVVGATHHHVPSEQVPSPEPTVTQCQNYSGALNTCPGG